MISIVISVAAQFTLKAGMGRLSNNQDSNFLNSTGIFNLFTNKYIVIGFLLYGVGALIWLSVLQKMDVSKAYPLVGLGFVLTTLVGFFLGEQVTFVRFTGVLLICTGVAIIGFFS